MCKYQKANCIADEAASSTTIKSKWSNNEQQKAESTYKI